MQTESCQIFFTCFHDNLSYKKYFNLGGGENPQNCRETNICLKLVKFSYHNQCDFVFFGLQMKHVNETFQEAKNKEVALMSIGITSGVGRLLFGRIADYVPGVKKVYLQVLSFPFLPQQMYFYVLVVH